MARDRTLESRVRWLQHDFHCSWQVACGIDSERYSHNDRHLGGFALLRSILEPHGNASCILSKHRIALPKLRHTITSFPDQEALPSMFALLARGGLLAHLRNEPILGSDHLLLALLGSGSLAAEMLFKLGIESGSVVEAMQSMKREPQHLEWRSEVVPRPPNKAMDALGLSERSTPPDDNRLGWALVRSLQSSDHIEPLQSELYEEIVNDDRSSAFWGNSVLAMRYHTRFLELAGLVGAERFDLARRVLKEDPTKNVTFGWDQPFTRTLGSLYAAKDALRWAQLSSASNASQALSAQGLDPVKVGQSLAEGSTGDGGALRVIRARWVARNPAFEGEGVARRDRRVRQVSTLHLLIAILVFEAGGEADVLREAGVDCERLCAFAQTVEIEP